MTTEIRYMNKDTWLVNGITLRKLATTKTNVEDSDTQEGTDVTIYWAYDVIVRHENGTEDVIGSKVGQVSRSVNGSGIQSATWDCPETALVATDAIRVNAYIKFGTGSWQEFALGRTKWITEQLGATKLSAVTWTFYTWTQKVGQYAYIFWNTETYKTRIENFTWTVIIYKITGYTRNASGDPLGVCTVWLFKTSTKEYKNETVSSAGGYYEFTVPDNVTEYFIRAYKDGTPNVFGTTDRNLKGVAV